MSGSGKGGDNRKNRRKPFKRREKDNTSPAVKAKKAVDIFPVIDSRFGKKIESQYERPKWTPPVPPAVSLPVVSCAWCEKPIKDISAAISEPGTGNPVHFDCVINRIIENEPLESGDTISYIGGGRFGVVHFNNPPDTRDFNIKKIFEWENKDNRSQWRVTISDHFSVT